MTRITNVKPNKHSRSLASLNQCRFPFRNCDISLPQGQTGSVYFFMSQYDTSYFHIWSTLCLRTTIGKYNVSGLASGTHIAINFRLFVLIDYICGLERKGK